MGTSVDMIDETYGYYPADSEEYELGRLSQLRRNVWARRGRRRGAIVSQKTECGSKKPASSQGFLRQALFRTRTGDPLLTMEVLYQLS